MYMCTHVWGIWITDDYRDMQGLRFRVTEFPKLGIPCLGSGLQWKTTTQGLRHQQLQDVHARRVLEPKIKVRGLKLQRLP